MTSKILGLSPRASRDRLEFTFDMPEAVARADFVQENGLDRQDFKSKLVANRDKAAPPNPLIASSSSGLMMSMMRSACELPERYVVGYPFHPLRRIVLVEVVGDARTSPDAVGPAMIFA
jgi:3-hydroxyacyl-CoA dehydrogenase